MRSIVDLGPATFTSPRRLFSRRHSEPRTPKWPTALLNYADLLDAEAAEARKRARRIEAERELGWTHL